MTGPPAGRPKAEYIAASHSDASPTAVLTRQTRGLSPARASLAAWAYEGPSRKSIGPCPAGQNPMLVATMVGVSAVTR